MALIDTPPDAVAELVQYRTLNSKRFDLGNGFHRIIHRLGRVHFQDDDGSLKDIDTSLRVDANGDTVADQLPFRFRMLKQGIGYAYQSRSGGTVICQLRRVGTTAISTTDTFTPTRNGNRLVFADVAPDTDIILQVNRNGIQTWRRLKSDAAAKSWRWGIQYDAAGQGKIDPTIRGMDGTDPVRRALNGLAITDSQPQDNGDGTFTVLRQETWDGTVVTVDPQTRVKSVTSDPVYPVLVDPDVTDHVAADLDDVCQNYFMAGTGNLVYTSQSAFGYTIVKFGKSGNRFEGGWRFNGISVAKSATISLAQLKLNVTVIFSGNRGAAGTLFGAAEDNAAAFVSGAYQSTGPITRSRTTASTAIARPTSTGINTYNVTSIVQELVNRSGWASGNSMAFVAITSESGATYYTGFEDYHSAGTSEGVLEITLAAGGGSAPPRLIHGGEHLGLLLWEAAGLC